MPLVSGGFDAIVFALGTACPWVILLSGSTNLRHSQRLFSREKGDRVIDGASFYLYPLSILDKLFVMNGSVPMGRVLRVRTIFASA